MTAAREKRWALITADGRHSWLGRHTDPTEEELTRASETLAQADIAGWLAVTEGVYYGRGKLSVMMVRPLNGQADWEAALAAFHEARHRQLSQT
jgi:hypothetical protein